MQHLAKKGTGSPARERVHSVSRERLDTITASLLRESIELLAVDERLA